MKTELTTTQSQHLIELGVPKTNATILGPLYKREDGLWDNHILFSCTDLLEILPKEIEIPVFYDGLEEPEYYIKYRIAFEWDSSDFEQIEPQYNAFYKEIAFVPGGYLVKFSSEELIDALYELTVWTIKNGHLKF